MANGDVIEARAKRNGLSSAWWLTPGKSKDDPGGKALANHIAQVATRLETGGYQDRWRTLVFYRHYFGRPTTSQFAYGMAKRPISFVNHFSQFEYQAPMFNLIGECGDVYVNRLFRNKTFTEVVPERGNFSQRQASRALTEWIDAEWDTSGFWEKFVRMGIDSLYAGSGLLKFWPDLNSRAPQVTCPSKDEVLLENPDDPEPKSAIQRQWASREDLLDIFGGDAAAEKAIRDAPAAFPAFFFGPGQLDCSNVVPLLAGWRLNHANGKAGRYVLAVGDYCLEEKKWDSDTLPFEKFDWHLVAGSYWGQGLAEVLLPLNDSINQHLRDSEESIYRQAWGKWLIDESSAVNEAALGDGPAKIVKYAGVKPELATWAPYPRELPEQIQALIKMAKERAHISEHAVKGELPGSLQSAVAISKYAQVDDANFAEMTGRLDAMVMRCAKQMIRLGMELRPKTNLPGRKKALVEWETVKSAFGDRPISLKCYGVNRLAQDPAGRQQQLDTMLANGEIQRKTYTRLSQTPDLDGQLDLQNAPQEAVDKMLDRIVEAGTYEPPAAFMDLDYAKERVEQRYLYEQDLETPQPVLDELLLWRAACIDLKAQLTKPDPVPAGAPPMAPPPGEFGSPEVPAPAPAAPQIGPAMGAPTGAPPPGIPLA